MIRWHWFLPPPIPGNKNAKEQLVLNELATRWQSPFTAISTAVAWPENNRLYTALVEQPGWWRTTNPSMLCLPACWDMFFPFRAKDGLIQISSMTQVRKRWNTKRIFFKKKIYLRAIGYSSNSRHVMSHGQSDRTLSNQNTVCPPTWLSLWTKMPSRGSD